jgi:hypothetical protein
MAIQASCQSFLDAGRTSTTVQDGIDTNGLSCDSIVYGEWKAFGQEAMKAEASHMDAGKEVERVYVREEGIEEVVAEAGLLRLVESETFDEVLLGFIEDMDLHLARSLMERFASVQSWNEDFPERMRLVRAHSTSACQAGDGTAPGVLWRSSQISSKARNLSEIFILSSGIVTAIALS